MVYTHIYMLYFNLYMIYYILYRIYAIWYIVYFIWYMIYDILYLIYDILYIIDYILVHQTLPIQESHCSLIKSQFLMFKSKSPWLITSTTATTQVQDLALAFWSRTGAQGAGRCLVSGRLPLDARWVTWWRCIYGFLERWVHGSKLSDVLGKSHINWTVIWFNTWYLKTKSIIIVMDGLILVPT